MNRCAVAAFVLLAGIARSDQIRIDHREGTSGNFAPRNLTTTPGYVVTFDAQGTPVIGPMSGGPGGVPDGNKTDITVAGDVWTVNPGVVTLAKMANLAPGKIIGRYSGTTGVPEAITLGGDFTFGTGTLALAVTPQPLDADLTDLADGSLTGSKVGPGIDAANLTTGTVPGARLPTYYDFPELTPGNPAADTIRLYSVDFNGFSFLEERDSEGRTIRPNRDTVAVGKVDEASGISKGQAVYISGASGAVRLLKKALATSRATTPAFGLAMDSAAQNGFIRILTSGLLIGVDTSAIAEGTRVFLSETTAGALTLTPPLAPNFTQRVGWVLRTHAVQGEIAVLPSTALAESAWTATHASMHAPGGRDPLTDVSADWLTSGTVADVRIAATIARDAEVAAAYQPLNTHLADLADGTLSGSKIGTGIDATNITAGTLVDARIDAALARDAEVAAAYQPLDPDLSDLADGSLTGSKVGSGIDGGNVTAGTVADARIASTLARDSEVTAAVAPFGPGNITFTVDNAGAIVTTGLQKARAVIDAACTITKVTVLADVASNTTVTIRRSAYPPTSFASIVASAKPTLTGTAYSQDATLTGWTTALAAGDILDFSIDTNSAATHLDIILSTTR